jgi:hypothetical protein
VNVIPGATWQPMGRDNLKIGVGVGFPLTDDKEYHEMVILSAFGHF